MFQGIDIIERNLGIEQLIPGRYQPRKHFDSSYINKLADSIKQDGILEPIVVRSTFNKNIFEIVAGECRWRAAQLAGLLKVPCRIGNYTNEQTCRIALIENTTRSNLNPIEEAEGLTRLIEEFSYTHLQVSKTLGIPRSEISNKLRLLNLDNSVKEMVRRGQLSEAHGKLLAGIKSKTEQIFLANECVKKQWSTRALDAAIKNSMKLANSNTSNSKMKKETHTIQMERNLSDFFGHPTQINLEKDNSGYLNIKFYNIDGLQSILQKAGFLKLEDDIVTEKY